MDDLKFVTSQDDFKQKSLKGFKKSLEKAMDTIKNEYISCQKNHSGTGDELVDNYYLIHKVYVDCYMALSSVKSLPFTRYDMPRIYEYAFDFLRLYNNHVDKDELENYLEDIGNNIELQNDEINLFISVFKVALIKITAVHIREKKYKLDIKEIISSLRFLSNFNFDNIYDKIGKNEKLLKSDPYYSAMDKSSKNLYRFQISKIAHKEKKNEREVIIEAKEKAEKAAVGRQSHFGYYLFENEKHIYIQLTIFIPIVITLLYLFFCRNIWGGLLLFLPVWEISKIIIDFIYSKIKAPKPCPRIEIKNDCPKTLVTVTTFIGDIKNVDLLAENIESYYFANKCNGIKFGFLADLPASDTESGEKDDKVCSYVQEKIDALNKKYGENFFACVRKRTFSPELKKFQGRERKRGAVSDFLRAVETRDTSEFMLCCGDYAGAKYFVALDGDTKPDIDSVKKLVGVLEHPLSVPVYNSCETAVSCGYGIAVPRIDISLHSSGQNAFTQIMGGLGGVEMYGNASFSIYQDLYGEGIFAGKGVINIECFNKVLTGAFPENKVLSHDILEGSFLNTVYVSDVAFSDSIPKNIISYNERSHRWIRGDWQNIGYIKNKIKRQDGETVKNPISIISKYKLFDNLRRSITPPVILLGLIIGGIFNFWIFLISLLAIFSGTILEAFNSLLKFDFVKSLHYRTRVMPAFTRTFLCSLLTFMFYPYIAIKNADAIVRAVYRLFRKQKLMEWTTAEQMDKKQKGRFIEYVLKMYPQYIGLLFLFNPIYLIVTAFWLAAVPVAYFISRPRKIKKYQIDMKRVREELRDMWQYFNDFLNETNNYLPPDNFQEEPLGVEARRTSPTNIGLAMLCCLGACDLGLINDEKLYFYIENILDTIDKLDKWNGHLLNWYNNETLKPLHPRYVSTVDNGNFIGFIHTLKNGLMEFNSKKADKLIKRIEDIISSTDFSLLYNDKKDLFYIGYDYEKNEYSNSYYDLYASESQLTSYFCIAKRQVPLVHWQKLGRYPAQKNGLLCIKSWTGTMFEYFMPKIVLPCYERSLSDEMLRAVISEQKRRNKKGIWGNSESAFYSFDPALVYQYKAFGVQSLALKRGMDEENVISPYSSWLAMPFFPKSAEENLLRIKKSGAYGKYGYFDAVDKTLTRTGGTPAIIHNFMVHHVAMSFLSGINALKDNIMQERFMDREMTAFSGLLEEKLPTHIIKYNDSNFAEVKKEYYHSRYEEHSVLNPEYPIIRILSNGGLSSFISDSGIGYIKNKDICVTKHRESIEEPKGVFSFFKYKGGIISSTYAPLYDKGTVYKTMFEEGRANYFARQKDMETKLSVTVNTKNNCEIRKLTIKNNSVKTREGSVLLYFEPVLTNSQTEESHPAFSGLFLSGEYENGNKTLYINRKKRSPEEKSYWLAVSCTNHVTKEKVGFEYELSRFKVLDHLKGISGIVTSFEKPFSNKNTPVDPCVAIRFPVTLKPRESASFIFNIAVGHSKQDAENVILKTQRYSFAQLSDSANEMIMSLYKKNELRKEDVKIYEVLASAIFMKTKIRYPFPRLRNRYGIEKLWAYGISGDFPIIMVKISEKTVEKIVPFLKAFSILKEKNADCEFVICFSEGGRYDRPVYNTVRDYIKHFGIEKYFNTRNGIFICNIKNMDEFSLIGSLSRFYADLEKGWQVQSTHKPYSKPLIRSGTPAKVNYIYKTGIGGYIEDQSTKETGFAISDKNLFPERPPWCHILANKKFGTVVSDSSLGFTFAQNASQNKITPWENDVVTDNTGERLSMKIDREIFNVIEGATAEFFKGRAEYDTMINNVNVHVTVFVPLNLAAKIISVSLENTSQEDAVLRYDPRIVLGAKEIHGSVNKESENDVLYFNNPINTTYAKGYGFLFGVNADISGFGMKGISHPGRKETFTFILGYANSKKQAQGIVSILRQPGRIDREFDRLKKMFETENKLLIETPDNALNLLFNTFLPYQTVYSRLTAKTGFYQCSGAVGFRDQLQDAICLCVINDRYLKKQLVLAAAHQFEEGDVLHWWHKGTKNVSNVKGARTKSSDDLLWLPFGLCEYIDKTDNMEFLKKTVNYIKAPVLAENEDEKYIEAFISEKKDTLYDHAKKAVYKGIKTGQHGLILFGSGDWNDGMNHIGVEGKGETVWGSFFSIIILERMFKLAIRVSDKEFANFCSSKAAELRKAIEKNAWDGEWYLRGYFDNGETLGSKNETECHIDLLPQAFSSITGGFDPYRVRVSLNKAEELLVDRKHRIIKLLDKPFANSKNYPGYIQGYVGGIRENGGQYTHAAVWFAWSLFADQQYEKAYEMLCLINPVLRTRTKSDVEKYRVEPYVITADVYSNPDVPGMGGWSHYTGAAGWYYKIVTEELLGIRRKNDRIYINPKLPDDWKGYSVEFLYGGAKLSIEVKKAREKTITVDGKETGEIILDGKNHDIIVLYSPI